MCLRIALVFDSVAPPSLSHRVLCVLSLRNPTKQCLLNTLIDFLCQWFQTISHTVWKSFDSNGSTMIVIQLFLDFKVYQHQLIVSSCVGVAQCLLCALNRMLPF